MKKIDLYFIVGFLGSGKTTFLKHFLQDFQDKKIAVVINDFGKTDIDAKLLADKIESLKEIHDGSVFCSCKSDQFVQGVTELSKEDVDIIIVESSGFANPNTLINVVDLIKKLAHNPMEFKGTIGIVDVSKVAKLINVAAMIELQIYYSDLILINKIDLVDKFNLSVVNDLVTHINNEAAIHLVTNAYVKRVEIESMKMSIKPGIEKQYVNPSSQKLMLSLDEIDSKEDFEIFLLAIEKDVLRIKGFITFDNQCYFFEAIDGEIRYQKHPNINQEPVIVILAIMKRFLERYIIQKWEKYIDSPIDIL